MKLSGHLKSVRAAWTLGWIILASAHAVCRGADKPAESHDKQPTAKQPPTPIPRETDGFDVIPGLGFDPARSAAAAAAYPAVRSARIHIKFGAAEHGNLAAFDAARRLLDESGARLAAGPQAAAAETVANLKREAVGLRTVAATRLFGRFPLIRAFGLEADDEDEEFIIHAYTTPGDAERHAIRDALTRIGKSASSDPLHVLILVPGESRTDRISSPLAEFVDSEAHAALTNVPNLKLYPGALRADLDPMPAWNAPDPAFAPICLQFLKRISPQKKPASVMVIMVREFAGEFPDGHWVQAQQRTFEAAELEKAEEKPEKLEAAKVRVSEGLSRDWSRFRMGTLMAICGLWIVSTLTHSTLSATYGPAWGGWQRWFALPTSGFLIGMILTPLIMLALQRWLPPPQTHAMSGAWWPCTAGALSLILPAGVFRLGAGSAGRYVPSISCHGRWGVAFVPVAFGVCAAWIRPATYALGGQSVHMLVALGIAAALLVYCFGRAIDLADHFPAAMTPIALALALVFGVGAFLGSPALLWVVAGLAGLTTGLWTGVLLRRPPSLGNDDLAPSREGLGARCPRTLEQLRAALQSPRYQPPPEFEQLRQALEWTGATRATWIGLVGASAAGKSAAARHLISELQASCPELQILVGSCAEGAAPFQPFREALTELGVSPGLIAAHAQGGEVNSVFERLADEFIPFWDFFSGNGDDDDEEKSRSDLLAAVTNALHAATQKQQLLLFLDDVQWIDEGSAAVLKHLRENFPPGCDSHLIVIVASRNSQPLEPLGLKGTLFSLTPPSTTEQVRILNRSLGIEPASAKRLIQALGVMSHETGAMFWLLRAIRELLADNGFTATSRGFALAARYSRPGQLPVPAALRAKLTESLRASGQYLPVLECAAILGEKFRVDDLAECLGMDRLKLLQILRYLEQEWQLVRDIPSDEECYAFSSTYLLEIIRDDLKVGRQDPQHPTGPSKIAREWNARIASVLERRTPRTPQLAYAIAQHFAAAGKAYADQSLTHCLAAARLARNQHAFQAARRFLAWAEQAARWAHRPVDFTEERQRINADEATLTGQSRVPALPAVTTD
jgi:hypothetical protein